MKQNAKGTLAIIGARRYTSADGELVDISGVQRAAVGGPQARLQGWGAGSTMGD